MTGLIPAYLKTVYKKEPVFSHSKIVYTIGQNTFKEKLGNDFMKKALIHPSLKEKDLEVFKEATIRLCSVAEPLMQMPLLLEQKR